MPKWHNTCGFHYKAEFENHNLDKVGFHELNKHL